MTIRKRYVVKIYDRDTGGEYEFDADKLNVVSEKGIVTQGLDWKPNGQERHCIKLWTGFDKWEDFETEVDSNA